LFRFILFIFYASVYATGYLSDGFEKSINYSFSTTVDNETYYEYFEDDVISVLDLKPKLLDATLNIVFKGRYELGYQYLFNSSFINGYRLPYRCSYNFIYFKYHFKEREKLPINLSMNFKYGEAASYRSDNDYIFNSRSLGLSIYKEVVFTKYSAVPILSYNQYYTYNNNIILEEYVSIDFSFLLKLTVNDADNTNMRDIIYLGPKVSVLDKDESVGFTIGLYHPIK